MDNAQVSGLRTLTSSISALTILDTKSSSIKSPALAIKESSSGFFSSSAKYLPTILSSRLSITYPASMTAFFKIPFLVPQSSLVTIKS